MTDILSKFSPDDFQTAEHYWSTFDNCETEISARWVIRFLQNRGEGWAPFSYDEINAFYRTQRSDPRGSFTFNRLVSGTHRHVTGPWQSEMVKNDAVLVENEGKYSILPNFLEKLVGGGQLKKSA